MSRRILSFMLILCLCMGSIPATAAYATESQVLSDALKSFSTTNYYPCLRIRYDALSALRHDLSLFFDEFVALSKG